jgi:hypothetical protein
MACANLSGERNDVCESDNRSSLHLDRFAFRPAHFDLDLLRPSERLLKQPRRSLDPRRVIWTATLLDRAAVFLGDQRLWNFSGHGVEIDADDGLHFLLGAFRKTLAYRLRALTLDLSRTERTFAAAFFRGNFLNTQLARLNS